MATKRILVSIIVCILAINIFTTLQNYSLVRAEKLYVGGNGEGNYSSIQYAINISSLGDIVYVYNGIYYEIIEINKSISLIGENKESTILNGKNSKNVITIIAPNVNITGFQIQNSQFSGILIKTVHIQFYCGKNDIFLILLVHILDYTIVDMGYFL